MSKNKSFKEFVRKFRKVDPNLTESVEKAFGILFESGLDYSTESENELVKEFTKYGLKVSDQGNKEFITGWLPDESGSFELGNLLGIRYFYNEDLYKIVDSNETIIDENNAEFSSKTAVFDDIQLDDVARTAYDMQRQLESYMRAEEASDRKFEDMAYGPSDNMYESSNQKSKENLIGGKGDFARDSEFNPKELKKGIKHEMEHTKDKKIAKEIAKDHLKENKKYYSLLSMGKLTESEEDNECEECGETLVHRKCFACEKNLKSGDKDDSHKNKYEKMKRKNFKKGMYESYGIKFKTFLEKFKEDNSVLIESIEKAFNIIFENEVLPKDHRIAITFEIITDESAEHGDAEEKGWEDEDGVSMEPDEYDIKEYIEDTQERTFKYPSVEDAYKNVLIKDTVKYLRDQGTVEASSSSYDERVWYTAYGERDIHTGDIENRSFHLKNYTPEEKSLIFSAMARNNR